MSLLTGLLAFLRLEEASGTRYDSHGAYDLSEVSGVGRDTGKHGYAASFPDGETGYLTRDITSTALALGNSDFTVACWAKVTTRGGLLFQWVDGIYCYTATGGALTVGCGGAEYEGDTFPTSTWKLIVIDFRASDDRLRIHLDGSTTTETVDPPGAGTEIVIGDNVGDTGDRWVDSFSVWSRILSDAERTQLFNGGSGLDYDAFAGDVTFEADFTAAFTSSASVSITRNVAPEFAFALSSGASALVTRNASPIFTATFVSSTAATLYRNASPDFTATFSSGTVVRIERNATAEFTAAFVSGAAVSIGRIATPAFVAAFTSSFAVSIIADLSPEFTFALASSFAPTITRNASTDFVASFTNAIAPSITRNASPDFIAAFASSSVPVIGRNVSADFTFALSSSCYPSITRNVGADFTAHFTSSFTVSIDGSFEVEFAATLYSTFQIEIARNVIADFVGAFSSSAAIEITRNIGTDFTTSFASSFGVELTRNVQADFGIAFTSSFSVTITEVHDVSADFVMVFTSSFVVEIGDGYLPSFGPESPGHQPLLSFTRPGGAPTFSFKRVVTMQPGETLTAERYSTLPTAINERLPYFDSCWRLAFFYLGLARQVRNPDSSGFLFPPQAEYFHSYQGLRPGQGDWPIAPAGMPEGASLSCLMMSYFFGGVADSEATRLNAVPLVMADGSEPATPLDFWLLRKLQVGALDLQTGATDAPVWWSARSSFMLYQGPRSPHGNAFGGYLPTPANLGTCEDPDVADGLPAPDSWQVKFTVTAAGAAAGYATRTYNGTCPIGISTTEPNLTNYQTHVRMLWRFPWAFYVVLNNGTVEVLPRNYYVEGPYTGRPKLRKTAGNQLMHALDTFAMQHRGERQNLVAESALQEGAALKATDWLNGAFKTQDFLERWYCLAPQRGYQVGENVVPDYPRGEAFANTSGIITSRTLLTHTVETGCVSLYGYAGAHGLRQSCRVAFVVNGQEVIATLTKDNPTSIVRFTATAGSVIVVKMLDAALMGATGDQLEVEVSEQVAMKPDLHDVILIERMMGEPGNGLNQNASGWLGKLLEYGCLRNQSGQGLINQPLVSVTESNVYEAFRRWSQCVRMLPANALIGYAVENGRSVLYYRRQALATGRGIERVEIIAGTGGIKEGREYEVQCGLPATGEYVNYAGTEATVFYNGEHFIGVAGQTDFEPQIGTEKVFELQKGLLDPLAAADLFDGIAERIQHVAPKQGWSNRWMVTFQFKVYHPSYSSVWKPDAYSDQFALNERAAFFSPRIAADNDVLWHVAYGQRAGFLGNMIAELPTGYRYMALSNGSFLNTITVPQGIFDTDERRDYFHKSCRIYEQDLEVESAEALTEGGMQVVKLTLSGRLHNSIAETDGAHAGNIARDPLTWDLDALAAEPFSTVENLLRKYIATQHTGRNFPAWIGDFAADSDVLNLPDNPYCSCWPETILVKMVPEPYIDGNNRQDVHDTPLFRDSLKQSADYLRVLSEACVDQTSSLQSVLDQIAHEVVEPGSDIGTWSVRDYDWEEVNRQAHGGSSLGLMPRTANRFTPTKRTRPDSPYGLGALPHCFWTAEAFNVLGSVTNKLTRYRVMLPWAFERQRKYYYGSRELSLPFACNTPTGVTFGYSDRVQPVPANVFDATPSDSEWVEDTVASAVRSFKLLGCDWYIRAERVDVLWRVKFQPGIEHAIPPYLRELIRLNNASILVWRRDRLQDGRRREVAPGTPGAIPIGGSWYTWEPAFATDTGWVPALLQTGTLVALDPVTSDCGYQFDFPGGPGSDGVVYSPGGSQAQTDITIIPGQTLLIDVPLRD